MATISTVMFAIYGFKNLKPAQRKVSSSHNVYTVPTQDIPTQNIEGETSCQEIITSGSKTSSHSNGPSNLDSFTATLLNTLNTKLFNIPTPSNDDADKLEDWQSGPCTINPSLSSRTVYDSSQLFSMQEIQEEDSGQDETFCQEKTSCQSETSSDSSIKYPSNRQFFLAKFLNNVKSGLTKCVRMQTPGSSFSTTSNAVDADNVDDWESGSCTSMPSTSIETINDPSQAKTIDDLSQAKTINDPSQTKPDV